MDPSFKALSPLSSESSIYVDLARVEELQKLSESNISIVQVENNDKVEEENEEEKYLITQENQENLTCISCHICLKNIMCIKKSNTYNVYICRKCWENNHLATNVVNYPAGTFKCCSASSLINTVNDTDVIICSSCAGWYHTSCLGITSNIDEQLYRFVKLSSTRWFCPEPHCCEMQLLQQMKKMPAVT